MPNHAVSSSVLCLQKKSVRSTSLPRCELADLGLLSSFIEAQITVEVHQVTFKSMLDWPHKPASVKVARPHRRRRMPGEARLFLGPSRLSGSSEVRYSGLHQARQPDARWPALDLSSCRRLKMSLGSLSPCLMLRFAALLRE